MHRQVKSSSLTQNLRMLGDIYLTLGWVAIQRLRHGPLWPWDMRPNRSARILTLRPPQNEGREEHETSGARRE